MTTEHKPHSVLGSDREVRLIRAIGAHRTVNPDAYRGLGLTVTEETAMVAALSELEEQLEAAQFALDGSHARGYREGVREEQARSKEQLEAVQANERHLSNLLAWREKERNTAQTELAACRMGKGEALEQLEVVQRQNDWLKIQLDGIIEDAEARFRGIGSGSESSGGEAQSARAFLANLRDARAALDASFPASEPQGDDMMLRHLDGTPYMDVFDYMDASNQESKP